MPKNVKTNVIIEHQTKGSDKARRDNERVNYSLKKIKGGLTYLKKEYIETNKELKKLLQTFAQQNKQTDDQARKRQKQGAFMQGLVQGGAPIPAMFLQRGPGMGRQMAGMAVGRTLGTGWNMGRAGIGGSFTGVQGLQQFLGSIPLVGGLLAAQVGRLQGYAKQGIGYQKTELGASPYLNTFSELAGIQKNRQRAASARKQMADNPDKSEFNFARKVMTTTARKDATIAVAENMPIAKTLSKGPAKLVGDLFTKGPLAMAVEIGSDIARSKHTVKQLTKEATKQYKEAVEQYKEEKKVNTERLGSNTERLDSLKQIAKSASQAARSASPVMGIAQAGLKYGGLNKQEAIQLFSEFMQSGGGVATGEQAKSMRGTSFAAKTLFGVQMGTSGAFLKGGRRGGIVGGMGNADQSFKDAINEGLMLGLSGSEINQWLQQIAQGINAFQQTGIPINVSSISQLATDISKSGIATTRGIAMSQGISQYIQGIGSRGITSGADIMMLRELGGFKGGGAAGFREARSRLESMQFGLQGKSATDISTGSPVGKALKRYMSSVGGDQATKAEMLQRLLQRWGVKGGVKEFDWLSSSLMGGRMGEDQALGASKFLSEQKAGMEEIGAIAKAGGLTGAASTAVSARAPNVRKMASIQNQQIDLGNKFAGTMQQLEQNALNVTKKFHALSGDALPVLSTAMGDLSMKALKLAKSFVELIESTGAIQAISSLL